MVVQSLACVIEWGWKAATDAIDINRNKYYPWIYSKYDLFILFEILFPAFFIRLLEKLHVSHHLEVKIQ